MPPVLGGRHHDRARDLYCSRCRYVPCSTKSDDADFGATILAGVNGLSLRFRLQQFRQLSNIRSDAPRLIECQHFRVMSVLNRPPGIRVDERLFGCIEPLVAARVRLAMVPKNAVPGTGTSILVVMGASLCWLSRSNRIADARV